MDGGVLALDRAHDRRATANAPAVPGEVGDSAEGRGSRGAGGRERVEAPRAQAGNEGRAGRGDGDGEGGGHGRCGRDDRMRVPEAEKSVFVVMREEDGGMDGELGKGSWGQFFRWASCGGRARFGWARLEIGRAHV